MEIASEMLLAMKADKMSEQLLERRFHPHKMEMEMESERL